MRTTLGEAVEIYKEREPKGEYVLIIEGAIPKAREEDGRTARERVADYISGGMDKKEAVKAVAKEMGVPKNVVYSETLDL
jgi:16S rRNA (cytidine1402-2'-O)-methyltransferase